MLSRIALLASALFLTSPAFATKPSPPSPEMCRLALPTIRDLWQHDRYDAPPAVAALMVDVIDGKLPQARQQLAALKPGDVAHWRQTAMLTAVYAGQANIVDALLDDGAAVDAMGWIPPFKPSFYGQTVDSMKHDPRFGGPGAVNGLAARGLLGNRGQHYGPALPIAAGCGDMATVNVLLRHHAQVMVRAAPNAGDALEAAIVTGNVAVVQRLLGHGADPCADDRRMVRFHLEHPTRPTHTLAQIGTRARLPAALVARLGCHASAKPGAPPTPDKPGNVFAIGEAQPSRWSGDSLAADSASRQTPAH